MQKRALITGVTGQDGSYLADLLLSKGYLVFGLVRRRVNIHSCALSYLSKIFNDPNFIPIIGDVTDYASIKLAIETSFPNEVYNLAAMSFVKDSWDTPQKVFETNAIGAINVLQACLDYIRERNLSRDAIKIYQASSSEMFGNCIAEREKEGNTIVLREDSPMHPASVYGVAKLAAHRAVAVYRKSYGMFICSGILFNHESERRGFEFVTRKISLCAAAISLGLLKERVPMGNAYAERDWGYAPEYVRAMYLMLQKDNPDDYVIATGESNSVFNFIDWTLRIAELIDRGIINLFSFENPQQIRKNDISSLVGDSSKARKILNWVSGECTYSMKYIAKEMFCHDYDMLRAMPKDQAAELARRVSTL